MIEIRDRKTEQILHQVDTDSLEGWDLRGVDLGDAALAGASLRGARLEGAGLEGADLTGADLRDADMRNAHLWGARLDRADLRGTSLRRAQLSRAYLTDADLRDADLRGACMWLTRLPGADLTGADLRDVIYDTRTRWPKGFDPIAAGGYLQGERANHWDLPSLYAEVVDTKPRWLFHWGATRILFHFGSGFSRASDFEPLGLRLGPALCDALEFGPQDIDLARQRDLRERFFRETDSEPMIEQDAASLDAYEEILNSGKEVLFWCDRRLSSCLGILWALDALHQRGANLGNAQLLLWPVDIGWAISRAEATQILENLLPVAELLEPLIAVRRHLASDSHSIEVDDSALPAPVREWLEVTRNFTDYLPDERGLDVPDSRLLDFLTDDWQSGNRIFHRLHWRSEADWPLRLRERLVELCGCPLFGIDRHYLAASALAESSFTRSARTLARPRTPEDGCKFPFRLSELGRRVRAGDADALAQRRIERWVGGRLITQARLPRRRRKWFAGNGV